MIKEMYKKYKQIINYLFIGGCTTVVSLVSFYVATLFLDVSSIVQLQVANVFSWICAVTFAYFTNRKFVFESTDDDKVGEAVRFVSSRISTLLVEMVIMTIFVSFLKWNENVSKLIVQFVIIVLNYVLSKFLVFNSRG